MGGPQDSSHRQGSHARRSGVRCSTVGRRGAVRSSASKCSALDDDTMESVVLQMLRARGLTLGLAESVTGGLVAGRLTAIAGASDVLRGSDRVVRQRGEVRSCSMSPKGRWSARRPRAEMAPGRRRRARRDVGLALTGVAGPAEQDGMPVGTLCIGVADRRRQCVTTHVPAARPARADAPDERHHRARLPPPSPARGRIGFAHALVAQRIEQRVSTP